MTMLRGNCRICELAAMNVTNCNVDLCSLAAQTSQAITVRHGTNPDEYRPRGAGNAALTKPGRIVVMARSTAINTEEQERLARQIGVTLLRAADEEWQEITVDYRCVGDHENFSSTITGSDGSARDWEPPAELLPTLQSLREGMYRPDVGTWIGAHYVVQRPASYRIDLNFDSEPDSLVPDVAFADELQRYPRDEEHIPEWWHARLQPTTSATSTNTYEPEPASIDAAAAASSGQQEAPSDVRQVDVDETDALTDLPISEHDEPTPPPAPPLSDDAQQTPSEPELAVPADPTSEKATEHSAENNGVSATDVLSDSRSGETQLHEFADSEVETAEPAQPSPQRPASSPAGAALFTAPPTTDRDGDSTYPPRKDPDFRDRKSVV